MSKVAAPRPRYIAFRMDGADLGRRKVAEGLRTIAPWMHLTRWAHPHGIVRVDHEHVGQARKMLAKGVIAGNPIETLRTSGTLKALTSALGILADRDAV